MRITVKVKPNSKVKDIKVTGKNEYTLRVRSPAFEGKANQAVVDLLSEYFRCPKSRIKILHGLTGKTKLIEIA